jgi:tRNA pseudouridine55 synthase
MDGILIIDKPEGWTSHDVVARARRLLREKRIGHTGTLDPFATGVLVLLVGRATRLAQFLSGAEKEYMATIRLGFSTDTGDLTGAPLSTSATLKDCAAVGPEEIETALDTLRGDIEQVPPMYSAKKIAGEKLYELARRGETVERKAVRVTVRAFEVVAGEGGAVVRRGGEGACDLDARVVCSAGTYVRALAESLGERLGTGAHLAALRRTRAGALTIEEAVTLEGLQAKAEAGAAGEILLPMNAALAGLPVAHLNEREAGMALNGVAVRVDAAPESAVEGDFVRLLGEGGELVGVAVYDSSRGLLRPRVMLAAGENKR